MSVCLYFKRERQKHASSFNPDNKPTILCTIHLEVWWVFREKTTVLCGVRWRKGFLKCFHFSPTNKHITAPKAVRQQARAVPHSSSGQTVCGMTPGVEFLNVGSMQLGAGSEFTVVGAVHAPSDVHSIPGLSSPDVLCV